MKYITGIAVATACVLGLMLSPDAKAEYKSDNKYAEYGLNSCNVQYAFNISRYAGKSFEDCAVAVAVNTEKFDKLPRTSVRLGWLVKAREICKRDSDVYAKQYCNLIVDAVERF